MSSAMQSHQWKLKGRLLSLDSEKLWDALDSISKSKTSLFPKAMNAIKIVVGTRDGRTERKADLSELPTLRREIALNDGYVAILLSHAEFTPGVRLELFPDCYVEVVIDQLRKAASITISTVGQEMADRIASMLADAITLISAQFPEHHNYLESFVANLLADSPDYEKNVFLIMRFRDDPPFPEIVSVLKEVCAEKGLKLLRADEREYTSDLWDNVMTYMYGCASAIAVFDQINYREFNPNVAIETGFMLATDKPVLLLKDMAIEAMPTDIVGRIYRPFNTYSARESIPPQVLKWIADYRLTKA